MRGSTFILVASLFVPIFAAPLPVEGVSRVTVVIPEAGG
jgi:hypothetical protein